VYYREGKRRSRPGQEKIYYIVFKKAGKVIEEKVGRQYEDKMTPARASRFRGERIENKRPSRKEIREGARAKKKKVWTIEELWKEYKKRRPDLKSLAPDENRFKNYLKPDFGNKEPQELVPLDTDRLRVRMLKKKEEPADRKTYFGPPEAYM